MQAAGLMESRRDAGDGWVNGDTTTYKGGKEK